MARHFAVRGIFTVAMDHPGVGSSGSAKDIFCQTPISVADAHHRVSQEVRTRLRQGTLLESLPALPNLAFIGLGHSMGGMLLDVTQGRNQSFDGIVGLGHSGAGLPEFVSDDERELMGSPLEVIERRLIELARARFGHAHRDHQAPDFFDPDVPESVKLAFGAAKTELLYACGLASIIPGTTDSEKAAITVPLFLAFGDNDLVKDLIGAAARYKNVDDATLFVLRHSGHNHNTSGARTVLWDRILRWLRSLL
jgi:pimeloyl-ACP methyl ester carboxylesterase